MMLTEMLPSLQQLSHQEKIRAIQFLATELAKEEQNINLLENGKTYEVWSPYDAFSAEKVLTDMLQQHKQQQNNMASKERFEFTERSNSLGETH
jgi:hypothetical protein